MYTGNAAFDHDRGQEIARILRIIAGRAEQGETAGTERDINGNTVAKWKL